MSLTNAAIIADAAAIFTDLAGSGVTETVQRIPAAETTVSGTFDIVRASNRKSEELLATGFSKLYNFSFFAQRAEIGETTEGDVLILDNGDRVRVLRMQEQPARVYVMFDVGDEFAAEDE